MNGYPWERQETPPETGGEPIQPEPLEAGTSPVENEAERAPESDGRNAQPEETGEGHSPGVPEGETSSVENGAERASEPDGGNAQPGEPGEGHSPEVPEGETSPVENGVERALESDGGNAPWGEVPPPYAGYPPYAPPGYSPFGNPPPPMGYVPYEGRPPKPMGLGTKVFVGILIGLAAVFVAGFLLWGILFSLESRYLPSGTASSAQSQGQSEAGDFPNATLPGPSKNTVGTAANPEFAGVALNPPATQEMEPRDIYRKIEPAIVGVVTRSASSEESAVGSGMILTADGYLLTNAHVIGYSRDNRVTVVLSNKTEHEAVVVGYDRTSDLAVLKIKAQDLPTVEFGSSEALSVGDWVFAIGNPRSLEFSGTLTRGIVSALNRKIWYDSEEGMTYIQTDAAINPGNSGGALVNVYGQVVGINTAKISQENYEGMGFSIAINKAKPVIDSLIRSGYVSGRVRLGIIGLSVSAQIASSRGVPRGVMILQTTADSPLNASGVQAEDIITALDGKAVQSMTDLDDRLLECKPGQSVTLTVYRAATGQSFPVSVTLLADRGELQS